MNEKNGFGKYTYSDGAVYNGYWSKDCWKGNGKITYPNGDSFEGVFQEDQQEGNIKFGQWSIDGSLKGNQLEGNIKMEKKGIKMQAKFSGGLQDGLMKIQKYIKGEIVNYRGEF